jgi:putative spermidine/putrescine transport system ATP-binding protein
MRLIGTRKQMGTGKRAVVAMRPEEITLGEGPDGTNTIAARVDNVEYAGRDSLVDVITASGTRLHVRATSSPALGNEVRVYVSPERVLVYPAP